MNTSRRCSFLTLLLHLMLLATAAWAAYRAVKSRANPLLSLYLASELLTTLVIEGWWLYYGRDYGARSYAVMWCEMRVIGVFCMVVYAGPRLWGAFAALGYAGALFLALPHFTLNPAIAASEGFLFVFAGVSAVLGKPDRQKAILAALWLLLAMFDAGY